MNGPHARNTDEPGPFVERVKQKKRNMDRNQPDDNNYKNPQAKKK